MELKEFAKSLDVGIYNDARKKGIPVIQYLEDLAIEKDLEGTTSTFKDMCQFQVRAKKAQLRSNNQPVPSHTFEKLLSYYGLHEGSTVEKFYMTAQSAILFPEYISQMIQATAMVTANYTAYVANIERISTQNYTKFILNDTAHDRSFARRADGAPFKRIQVKLASTTIPIKEFGAILEWDYNTIRYAPVATLRAMVFDRIGIQFGIDILDLLIYTAINGDGVTLGLDTALYQVTNPTPGTIINEDIVNFMTALPQGYQINAFFSRVAGLRKYLVALGEMTNPQAQKGEVSTGLGGIPYPTPKRWDSPTVIADNILLGLDTTKALGLITTDQFFMQEVDQVVQAKQVDTVLSAQMASVVYDRAAIGSMKWKA